METEYIQQQPKASVSIQSLFGGLPPMKKTRELSPRAFLLSQLMAELGFEQAEGKKIFGQTSKMTNEEIRDIWQRSRSWKKAPKALFWTLVKKKNAEIREQLATLK